MSEALSEEGRARRLQNRAHKATIVAAMIATAGFIAGGWFSRDAAHSQARSVAVSVLQDYYKLAIEHQDLANRPDERPMDERYEWFASQAYFTAETIFILTGDTEWRNTVRGIVHSHHAFVRDGGFVCEDFNPRFVKFVRTELPDFKCATDSAGSAESNR
jgi:hypothetical protein